MKNIFEISQNCIPRLSHSDIERKVEDVITYFDKSILYKAQPTPLIIFIEIMNEKHSVRFNVSRDLGENKEGKKILGLFKFRPLEIFIDSSLIDDLRFNFTLGHEFGHLVLHRNLVIKKDDYNGEYLYDTKYDLVTGKKKLLTSKDRLEWQANRFSSALLMPCATFIASVGRIQQEMGIKRNQGYIILNDSAYSIRDYKYIINKLKEIYCVNETNIEYRLKDLGILIDQRSKNIFHISELFK